MDSTIIIVLAIILLALIILNNIKIVKTENQDNGAASCSQTTFGCCPNGIDSKINYYGTNCPGYSPAPGLMPTPVAGPNPVVGPTPVAGPNPRVDGTPVAGPNPRVGGTPVAGPNPRVGETPVAGPNPRQSNQVPVPAASPAPRKPIGGCSGTRYGCCPDNTTTTIDEIGRNCF